MKLIGFVCCLMFLQGSMAFFSLKITGMASFQTDITKNLTPIKGLIMKMESSLTGLLKEVNVQADVPAPLMGRMPVDIFIAYSKMMNTLFNDFAKYMADSSLTVPRVLALLDADVKAITDFFAKYAPETKGGELDTSFSTKFGSAYMAFKDANTALSGGLQMMSMPLQKQYAEIIPLKGESINLETVKPIVSTQIGLFATNIPLIQESTDGLTKTISGANKMQAALTTVIVQIPASIKSTVATLNSDVAAAIKTTLMGYSANAKAMTTAFDAFTAKLQSSYSDTTVGVFIPEAVKKVDEYVASINAQMLAISTGVSVNAVAFSDSTAASGSYTADALALGTSLTTIFTQLQEFIQTTFKKNTDTVRTCMAGATKGASDIATAAKTQFTTCVSAYSKKFSTSEKNSATASASIKTSSSTNAKTLLECMGTSHSKKSTLNCIDNIVKAVFTADLTAQTMVSSNAVSAIMADYMSSQTDYTKACITAVQTVASMSLDAFKMMCQS